jgi:hypothetical protein
MSSADALLNGKCPTFVGTISVFHSAVACFYSPSDLCGAGGMHRERIRSTPNWRGTFARYDTMFIERNPDLDDILGMAIGRARLLFSFKFRGRTHACALVDWFSSYKEPDDVTGMWVVEPEFQANGRRASSIVDLNCIVRGAHLLPVYGSSFLPEDFHFADSLDAFRAYFVSPYIDHHSHELLK